MIHVRESNNDSLIESNNMNYYGKKSNIICNVARRAYIVSQDQMNQITGKNIDFDIITRMYGENPM
jgi:hypothetical protein